VIISWNACERWIPSRRKSIANGPGN